jgi:hypothetical protein
MYCFQTHVPHVSFRLLSTYTILSVVITRLNVRFQHVQIFVRRIFFNTNANISGTLCFVLFEQLYELTLRVRIYNLQSTNVNKHIHTITIEISITISNPKNRSIPPRYLLVCRSFIETVVYSASHRTLPEQYFSTVVVRQRLKCSGFPRYPMKY